MPRKIRPVVLAEEESENVVDGRTTTAITCDYTCANVIESYAATDIAEMLRCCDARAAMVLKLLCFRRCRGFPG